MVRRSGFDFDVIIIGSGPAGMLAAYELSEMPDLKVAIFEGGSVRPPWKPEDKEVQTQGWGGAGAFSDGKLELTTRAGGQLQNKISEQYFKEIMTYVDSIYLKFGGESSYVNPTSSDKQDYIKELKDKAFAVGLDIVPFPIRHFGTDGIYLFAEHMRDRLRSKGVRIYLNTPIARIQSDKKVINIYTSKKEKFSSRVVIAAPGRYGGMKWFDKEIKRLKIPYKVGGVDIGLRIETRASIMKDITDVFHEIKIYYQTRVSKDPVRIFCMCPNGFVTAEQYHGLTVVNGHSYENSELKSENTNFALLVTQYFTEPFRDPNAYGRSIAEATNQLAGEGKVLVQRLGDLRNQHRSHEKDLPNWFIKPTLKNATPGDIKLGGIYPRHLDGVLEMLQALDAIVPGVNGDHTLLYAPEIKFYSVQIETTEDFEVINTPNLYVAGDGSGYTRGLLQSSMMGVIIARALLKKLK